MSLVETTVVALYTSAHLLSSGLRIDKEGFRIMAESLKQYNTIIELDFKGELDGGGLLLTFL